MRNTRGVWVAVLAAVVLAGPVWDAASSSARAEVVRYVGATKGTAWSRPVMKLIVVSLKGAKSVLVVPNQNPMGHKYDPHPIIVKVVKDLKKGDLVTVKTGKIKSVTLVQSIGPYELKPGEDEPNGFVFVGSEEKELQGKPTLIVTLEKFGEQVLAAVPPKRDKEGKFRPDPALAAAIDKLKTNDVVVAHLTGRGKLRLLKSIVKYVPPIEGTFVKLVETSNEKGSTAAVQVETPDGVKTVALPAVTRGGKTAPDPRLYAAAKRLKAGDYVAVKFRTEKEALIAVRIAKTKRPDEKDKGKEKNET